MKLPWSTWTLNRLAQTQVWSWEMWAASVKDFLEELDLGWALQKGRIWSTGIPGEGGHSAVEWGQPSGEEHDWTEQRVSSNIEI